jgi:signal transduction histidine kinase
MTLRQLMELSVARGNYTAEAGERLTAERMSIAERRERVVFQQRLAAGRIIEITHQPLEGGGFVTTYTDATEREKVIAALRAAKEAAELASRTKSDFLANMSHELRTPLNAIIGFSEALDEGHFGALPPRPRGYIRDIRDAGRHLLAVINNILDLSKVEAGKVDLVEEPVDIPTLVEDSVVLIRDAAHEKNLALSVQIASGLPPLMADPLRLKQILVNLLSNAIKFTAGGGRVTVAAAQEPDGRLAITVADTGIGIAPDDIQKVLSPFGQVENIFTRSHQGSGLGLPLSKALVELHGGTLTIESELDHGTVVTARMPAERLRQPIVAAAE